METLVKDKFKVEFDNKEQLIYDIIFFTKQTFSIDIDKYCSVEDRPKFRSEIRSIIKQSGLTIVDDRIIHTNECIFWKIQTNITNDKRKVDKTK